LVNQCDISPVYNRVASIVLECIAHRHLNAEIRMKALTQFIEKYSPNDKEKGLKYAEASFNRIEIIRIDIIKWSDKRKKI
jgi:hypothetical protein